VPASQLLTARAPTPSVAPGELTRTAATASPVPAQSSQRRDSRSVLTDRGRVVRRARRWWRQVPHRAACAPLPTCKHSWTKPTPSSWGSRSSPVARTRRSRASTQATVGEQRPAGVDANSASPPSHPTGGPGERPSHPRTPNRSKAQLSRPGAAGLPQVRPDPSKWSWAVGDPPCPPRLSPSAFRGWHLTLLHRARGAARHPGSAPAASPPRGAPLVLRSTCSFLACAGRGRASSALDEDLARWRWKWQDFGPP
jgi:hypothetical protein